MKFVTVLAIAFCIARVAVAQEVKIVFDVTSDDPKIHSATIRHVKAMSEAYPNSTFELVIYSGALPMALKEKSEQYEDMKAIASRENVMVNVCAMSLNRYNLDDTALIEGVGSVPDGILEIAKRQNEGWAYIKEAY